MADVTLNVKINDRGNNIVRVRNAIDGLYPGRPNGIKAWTELILKQFLIGEVRRWEHADARQTAIDTVNQAGNPFINETTTTTTV